MLLVLASYQVTKHKNQKVLWYFDRMKSKTNSILSTSWKVNRDDNNSDNNSGLSRYPQMTENGDVDNATIRQWLRPSSLKKEV